VFVAASQPNACSDAELSGMVLVFRHRLLVFQQSTFVEVQERAHACRQTLLALNVLLPQPVLPAHFDNGNGEGGASTIGDGNYEQKMAAEAAASDHSLMAAMPEMSSNSSNSNDGLFDLLGDMSGGSFSSSSSDLAAANSATSTSTSGPAAGSAAAVAAAALAAQTQVSLATGKEADEAAAKAVGAAREGASTLAALVVEPMNPVGASVSSTLD